MLSAALLQCCFEGVEGEGAQEVAAHAAFDFGEAIGGGGDPIEVGGLCEFLKFALDVGVANEFGGLGVQGKQVLKQGINGAQELLGPGAAVGAGSVGFRRFEEFAVFTGAEGGAQDGESMLPGGGVGGEIEAASAAHGAIGE